MRGEALDSKIKIEENKYYKRQKVFIRIFKEKADLSKFPKITRWFYFGNCWEKVEGKRIFNYEKAYYTPYKELVYKKFLRWQRKIEKNGVNINRPYLSANYVIYKNYKSGSVTFAGKLRNLKRKPLICTFDYFDIENFLINKLTVAGLYSFMFGHSTISKRLGHEMWIARKMLLDAINYGEKQEYLARCRFREKFGVRYRQNFNNNNYKFIEPATEYIHKVFPELIGKDVENEEIKNKAIVMEDFWEKCYFNEVNLSNIEDITEKLLNEAFAYISENYRNWWD